MIQWNTLNKGVVLPRVDSSEVKVERFLELYKKALRLHHKEQYNEAKSIYEEILNDEYVREGGTSDSVTQQMRHQTMTKSPLTLLRFLVNKNYASLLDHEFSSASGPSRDMDIAKNALKHYLKALDIDATELSLWFRVGCLSVSLGNIRLARSAYEKGLLTPMTTPGDVDHQQEAIEKQLEQHLRQGRVSPMQWRCLGGLCEVLVEIGDHETCRLYMNIAKKYYPDWPLGRELESKMTSNMLDKEEDGDEKTVETPPSAEKRMPLNIQLEELQWSTLVETLLKTYHDIINNSGSSDKGKECTILSRPVYINISSTAIQVTQIDSNPQAVGVPDAGADNAMDVDNTPPVSLKGKEKAGSERNSSQEQPSKKDRVVINLETGKTESATQGEATSSSQTSITDTNSLKRPRSDENNGNEEEESEDKRTTLRASKRQREKLETEENWRRQMYEEELQLSSKFQKLFDKLETVLYLKRENPWHRPLTGVIDEPTAAAFWKWFDGKVAELNPSYTWDLDTERAKDDDTCLDTRKYAAFTENTAPGQQEDHSSSNETVMEITKFIYIVNMESLSIVDVLCRLALTMLELDADFKLDTADYMLDIVKMLDSNIIDTILYNKPTNDTTSAIDVLYQKLKIVVRLCERFMDKLIGAIMEYENAYTWTTTIRPSRSSGSSRKSAFTASKAKQESTINDVRDYCDLWIGLFERIVLQQAVTLSLTSSASPTITGGKESPPDILLLRYWFVKGKMAQCNDSVQQAFSWYERCANHLKELENRSGALTIDINCRYDTLINSAVLQEKLTKLGLGKSLEAATSKFAEKDYASVITELADVAEKYLAVAVVDSPVSPSSAEAYKILKMMAKSYSEMGNPTKAWLCHVQMLERLIVDLVAYGTRQVNEKTMLEFNSDAYFLRTLRRIDKTLEDIVFTMAEKAVEWPAVVEVRTVDLLAILLQMTVYYIFRHVDFLPLVSNYKASITENVNQYMPSPLTRSGGFNRVVVNAWVIFSTVVQHAFEGKDPSFVDEAEYALVDLLMTMHDELGERSICSASNSIFLKHLLQVLLQGKNPQYRMGIYQCYLCLYGVLLTSDSDIEEHHSTREKLNPKAAGPMFSLVADTVVDKLERNVPLRNDMKNVIDTVCGLFDALPTSNNNVRRNKSFFEAYLARSIDLTQCAEANLRNASLPTIPIHFGSSGISPVYAKVFWIRGKILRMQIRNRAKVNPERTMDDLEEAVKAFSNHLILNPDDANGWLELAECLMHLAEEEMSWSAANIAAHKNRIVAYQRQAYHAFFRAWYLSLYLEREKDDAWKFQLFSNFGLLLYAMTCPPMKGDAFVSQTSSRALGKAKQLYNVTARSPDLKNAYRLALLMFANALRHKTNDTSEWRCLYMIGKCYKKLGRPPQEVLAWFQEASRKTPARAGQHGGPEKILEPDYQLCASLLKYLYEGKIDPNTAVRYLQDETSTHPGGGENAAVVLAFGVTSAGLVSGQPVPIQNNVYDIIFKKLADIRSIDKQRWHHRPVFRHSWMYYHIYRNPIQAKAELLRLFTLRSNVRSHINIWKPGYERPGKHYEYAFEYTMFLIQLAKDTDDTDCLKVLCDKLQKAATVLVDPIKALEAAQSAIKEVAARRSLTAALPPPPPPPPSTPSSAAAARGSGQPDVIILQ